MRKKGRFGSGAKRFTVLVLVLFVFVVLKSSVGLAYEKEIILSEAYQTKKEKELYQFEEEKVSFLAKKRFHLDIGFSTGIYGSAFNSDTWIYGPPPELKTYLKQLDMEYSENLFTLSVSGTYVISPKMGIYLGIPFGVVLTKGEPAGGGLKRLFVEENIEFGIGDVYGGVYYQILSEPKYWLSVIGSLGIDSNTAEFLSLGDGLWDFTPFVRVSKFITRSFYLFGVGGYTYRLEENNIDPGGIVSYGGGMGFLFGDRLMEAGLTGRSIGKTKFGSETLFKSNEDLIFNISSRSLVKGIDMDITIGNLNEGLDAKINTVGVAFTWHVF